MTITAKDLNCGYQYTKELNEANTCSLYKEGNVYIISGFFEGGYFRRVCERLKDAKECFNTALK